MRLPLAAWGVIWYYGNMSLNATKVAVTRRLPADIEERMGELFDTRFNQTDAVLSRQELGELMADHDVLVPTVADVIDGALIDAAGEQLKLIANFGNGTDNIDVDAAHARGITVTNTPSVLTEDTADMVMALILAVPRRLVEGDRLIRKPGSFKGWSPTWMLGRRLAGKRLWA